jgi:hypothetical protein
VTVPLGVLPECAVSRTVAVQVDMPFTSRVLGAHLTFVEVECGPVGVSVGAGTGVLVGGCVAVADGSGVGVAVGTSVAAAASIPAGALVSVGVGLSLGTGATPSAETCAAACCSAA